MESLKERKARLEQERLEQKERNNRINKLRSSIRSDITKSSYLSVRYQLQLIEGSVRMMKDVTDKYNLTDAEVIESYNYVFDQHLGK